MGINLSANENCYGCSPRVTEAVQKKIKDISLYPDFNPLPLEEKLAGILSVTPGNIAIGAGSVRVIDGMIQTFCNEEDEIITFERSFSAYGQLAVMHRKRCLFAQLKDWRCEVTNILPLLSKKNRLIFIANPNNPTGTIITHDELKFLLSRVKREVLVVVDEAYREYITSPDYPESLQLQKEFQNLVIVRTFSKVYGLAGLRIGYAIAHEKIIAELSKERVPYSLNCLAIPAALAALDDKKFISGSVKANTEQRTFLYEQLTRLGFNTIQSQANFVYLWFESDREKEKTFDILSKNGIHICNLKIFGQDRSLRITVGDKEANRSVIETLSQISIPENV
ncbi:MAG: histidinol-phosphate transaminase [Bacteroidetes bacterium]|nr:histidinol-phosphate transaminase [Bacteroidota bacterium]